MAIKALGNPKATYKRYEQEWGDEVFDDLDKLLDRAILARRNKSSIRQNSH